jgi:ketosteroid isomerase-like protein
LFDVSLISAEGGTVERPAATTEELLTRLRQLEDKDALASLLNRYAHAVDAFDWEAWGVCWAPDAVADFGRSGPVEGRDAIVGRSRAAQDVYRDRGGMQHLLANLELTVNGDTAEGSGNLLFSSSPDSAGAPPDSAVCGKYRWEFVRAAEGWQIKRAWLRRVWSVKRAIG